MLNKLAGRAALAIAVLIVGATSAQAQGPGGPMAGGPPKQILPAEWVLSHKADLKLTADQVKQLEALTRSEADSQKARMERIQKSGTVERGVAMSKVLQDWAGPIDEKAMRDLSREQAQFQADLMIGMLRDRRTVGKVLTDAQRAQLQGLERKDMMAMMAGR